MGLLDFWCVVFVGFGGEKRYLVFVWFEKEIYFLVELYEGEVYWGNDKGVFIYWGWLVEILCLLLVYILLFLYLYCVCVVWGGCYVGDG